MTHGGRLEASNRPLMMNAVIAEENLGLLHSRLTDRVACAGAGA